MRTHFREVRLALAVGLIATSLSTAAGTIHVNSTASPNGGFCTLAQAIYAANLANNPTNAMPSGATTIAPLDHSIATTVGIGTCTGAAAGANTIDLSTYAGQTITFSIDQPDNYWYGPNVLPSIASDITIEGHGAKLFIQNGTSPRARFFFVGADPQATVSPGYNTPGPGKLTLRNLTLTGGRQQGGSANGAGAGMGGAIFNQGTLTIDAVTFNDNRAVGGNSGFSESNHGGGMGADGGSGGGMGGPVPSGSGDPGATAVGFTAGNGGGIDNGLGGAAGAPGGNGSGGGGNGTVPYNIFPFFGGGGGGFGGGNGGAADGNGGGGGAFGQGGGNGDTCVDDCNTGGGGGGVGSGGGYGSDYGGGGGFGGGGAFPVGRGGFGGGGWVGGFAGGSAYTGAAGGGMGGAIFNHNGLVTLLNCTMTANVAQGGNGSNSGGSGFGGAIFNLNGEVRASFSTLAFNSAIAGTGSVPGTSNGGAIYTIGYNGAPGFSNVSASVGLSNSIASNSSGGSDIVIDAPFTVANGQPNSAPAQIINAFENLGPNIVMTTENLNGADVQPIWLTDDPLLGLLGANAATNAPMTLALLPGSPAIQVADCLSYDAFSHVTADERGSPRPVSGCDLGAYDGERIFASGF